MIHSFPSVRLLRADVGLSAVQEGVLLEHFIEMYKHTHRLVTIVSRASPPARLAIPGVVTGVLSGRLYHLDFPNRRDFPGGSTPGSILGLECHVNYT